jgi:hypothetical protein
MVLLAPIKDNFYALPTEGLHRTTIIDVVPGGESKCKPQYGQRSRILLDIVYRIEDQQDADGQPILYTQHVTFVIRLNSDLNKLLIRLGILIDFKSPAFDVHSIVGKTTNINIQHTRKGPSTFANVVDGPVPMARRQVATIVEDLDVACKPVTS